VRTKNKVVKVKAGQKVKLTQDYSFVSIFPPTWVKGHVFEVVKVDGPVAQLKEENGEQPIERWFSLRDLERVRTAVSSDENRQRIERIGQMLALGASLSEVGATCGGITRQRVAQIAQANGFPTGPHRRTIEQEQEIILKYSRSNDQNQNLSLAELAKDMKLSVKTVMLVLNEHQIPIRQDTKAEKQTKKAAIQHLYEQCGKRQVEIANELSVSRQRVNDIIKGRH
jgi:hypothetical protein